ncbi:MAG: winged helix-turn-helix domain-containing protein [Gammaproteobacteria bacterium]
MNAADGDNTNLRAFGGWRFDAGTGDLFDGTTTSRLAPQVARLLDYFLANQDKLISRDELMAAVWDNRVVSDDAINRCVSILRNTLSPDEKNAYIETVVRRGFISHFPPPVDEEPRPVDEEPPERRRVRHVGQWTPVLLTGLALVVLFGALRIIGGMSSPAGDVDHAGTPMVAVLPFLSAGLAGDSEFFARGVHDDLLTQLAQLQSMRVISRTSVSEYRDSHRNMRDIGTELGADAILEGGVQRIGDQIRINAQLIDAHSDIHLWAQQYDRELTPASIFDIQMEIARSIASALHATLTRQDDSRLNVLPTENMGAYRAYHEAMALRSTETIAARDYVAALERAVALDPEFVRAWAELAGSLSYSNIQRRDPASIRRLEDMLERIRALAPDSSEYLIAQSYYTYYILKDHGRAFELIRQARDARPSDPQLIELQSWIQRRQGDIDGMIASIRQARSLDPRNPYWTTRLVSNLALAHRYDEAAAELASAPVDSFELAVLAGVLRVREHRDPVRILGDLTVLQTEYGREAEPFDLWEARIAARDYEGAARLVGAAPSADEWTGSDVPDVELARIITGWFLDAQPRSDAERIGTAEPGSVRTPGVPDFEPNVYLAMAYVAATAGDTAEGERLVRVWFREVRQDLAEKVSLRHHACRALGMAAAVSAAVDCLRSGLAEPSLVMPFIEPYLPYYDPVRGDPRFVEFLGEIRGI